MTGVNPQTNFQFRFLFFRHTQLVESVISYVLLKTQSQSDQVRKCAIETLASLVLEDYLKFRGSLLLYVLAATADQKNNIARLSHELIIKYANEKNAILIRSCLRECPFAFNDCKLVENSEMFGSGLCAKSPLKAKADERKYIYRFLVHNLEVINCYTYFENFSTIQDRLTRKDFQKTAEFIESIRDFLYICEHICKSKEIPKSKAVENANEGDEDGDASAGPSKRPDEAAASALPTTSKRNRQQMTLPEAMVVVEKSISRFPELRSILVEKLDANFDQSFDRICFAISEHFGDSIKYFPHLFWDKYRKAKPTKRNRRKNDDEENDSDDDTDTSKASRTTKRNESGNSTRLPENSFLKNSSSVNDVTANTTLKLTNTVDEPRSSRKRTRSMATNDSGSDGDEGSSVGTPKTPKRKPSEEKGSAKKSMVIDDSDSDNESAKSCKFKTPKSVRKESKRTPRSSRNH